MHSLVLTALLTKILQIPYIFSGLSAQISQNIWDMFEINPYLASLVLAYHHRVKMSENALCYT